MYNVLVINNVGNRKKRILYKKKVLKFLQGKCNMFRFISIDNIETVNTDKFDTIISMGGDGTVNKILPYVINNEKVLCILPCGTANLIASKLQIPQNIDKALKILETKCIKSIDVLKTNEYYFISRIGFGYDNNIISKPPQHFKQLYGYFAYFITGVLYALFLKPEHYKIFADDKQIDVMATDIIISNAGNLYKNMFSVGNNEQLDDETFELFILKAKNPITFFYEFLRILLNIKKTNSRAMYLKARKLKIKNYWRCAHIDGETRIFKDDIDINILPKAVKVYAK